MYCYYGWDGADVGIMPETTDHCFREDIYTV